MRQNRLPLFPALLFAALLPLGCADDPSSPQGTGGTSSGGSGGSAKGGSGGGSTAKGGNGGTSSSGGAAGSGGTSVGGSGGSQPGGTSGSGGQAGGGAGGQAGGGGGSTRRDGGGDGVGGNRPDARDFGRGDSGEDSEPAPDGVGEIDTTGGIDTGGGPTCEDQKQNGNETDTDCGGADCPKCGGGLKCKADTDCRSGKCTSEKCADPYAATGTVTQSGNRWKITMGTTILEVDATAGAMIVTYSIDSTNFLVSNSASNGSVFWTAPQSEWNWPPPEQMDTGASYTPTSANNVLTMVSPVGKTDKLTVTKKFWGNVENQTVTIEYTVKNGNTAAVQKAPWEITRVYPGGLTFFPTAEEPVVLPGQANFKAIPFTTAEGVAWWKYKATEFTQDVKSGADGLEGWAAHVNCGTELEQTCKSGEKSIIMIKQWVDTTKQAPDEKEVEIYANSGHNYVEFEQQGDYASIPAGGTMTWTMHWQLRYLPTDVAPTVGNKALVDWVRSQLL